MTNLIFLIGISVIFGILLLAPLNIFASSHDAKGSSSDSKASPSNPVTAAGATSANAIDGASGEAANNINPPPQPATLLSSAGFVSIL